MIEEGIPIDLVEPFREIKFCSHAAISLNWRGLCVHHTFGKRGDGAACPWVAEMRKNRGQTEGSVYK